MNSRSLANYFRHETATVTLSDPTNIIQVSLEKSDANQVVPASESAPLNHRPLRPMAVAALDASADASPRVEPPAC